MGRLGDLLKTERLRRNLSLKNVAKLGGVSEQYLQAVEAGTRIISDSEARRLLKKMGIKEPTEASFNLDEIASTIDLQTIIAKENQAENKIIVKNDKEDKLSKEQEENPEIHGSIWLDALSSVIKKVPVYNAVMQQISTKLLAIDKTKDNWDPNKVMYFIVPDNAMSGFRLLKDDIVFIANTANPVDNAIMLLEINKHYCLRKVKKLDAFNVLLQSFDREYEAQNYKISDIKFIGKCLYFEANL